MMRTLTPRRIAAAAVALVAASLALSACGSGQEAPGTDAPAGSLEGKTAYLVSCGDENQWCRAYNKIIVDELTADGVDVTYLQDPYDPVLQVQHLNQAISQQPDAIFLLASDAKSVIPSLQQAQAAGVPVINIIGPTVPESADFYTADWGINHKQLGENAANLLVQGLQEEGVTSGNVIAITGANQQPEVAVRMDAFTEVMSQHPEYDVVDTQDGGWDQVKTAQIAQQLFAKYADQGGIVGAFGMADQMAAGIIQSAQQAGMTVGVEDKGLVVVASNCFAVGMQNIEAGLQYGTSGGTAGKMAEFTLPLMEQFLSGEDYPKSALSEEAPITRENLDEWTDACSVA